MNYVEALRQLGNLRWKVEKVRPEGVPDIDKVISAVVREMGSTTS